MSETLWAVHCDGSAYPNPGRMAYGVVIDAPDGRRLTRSAATSHIGCNNEAELRAVIAALQALQSLDADGVVRVFSDNSVVVAQLQLQPAVAPAPIVRLAALFDEARRLMAVFGDIRLEWIPRHRNGEADTLARAALGLPPKPADRRLSKARRRNG